MPSAPPHPLTRRAVRTGPEGTENLISSGGPLYTFVGICLAAVFWALPTALMTTELSTAFPEVPSAPRCTRRSSSCAVRCSMLRTHCVACYRTDSLVCAALYWVLQVTAPLMTADHSTVLFRELFSRPPRPSRRRVLRCTMTHCAAMYVVSLPLTAPAIFTQPCVMLITCGPPPQPAIVHCTAPCERYRCLARGGSWLACPRPPASFQEILFETLADAALPSRRNALGTFHRSTS